MARNILFFSLLVIASTYFSGCIHGEMYIAPLESLLSHPITKEEVPNYYERRYLNNLPHRNNRSQRLRREKRRWGGEYEYRYESRGRRSWR